MIDTAAVAEIVDSAAKNAKAISQLSENGYPLSLAQAYQVQAQSIARRLERGERLIGIKMGFTSRAKMIQMGVDDLIWGRLTNTMLLEEGAELDMKNYVHPRIEPEIAFRLKQPLKGEVSLLEAMAAVEAVAPAMEIIDSRYENFKFSLQDVVADNSSSSGVVIGAWQQPSCDLSNLGMAMFFDGEPVQIGSSAAIMGNPYRSLVAAARLAAAADMTLEPGWIVLAGASTAAEALRSGVHVRLETEQLGVAEISVAAQ
ncbi:fumarylacetoacetate hydrolase family protein [Dasania sp. GY-MA-18]|uniref:Fumarylacetoacetate hydrolase family protein n=1 Tax=Dasania phycosphaerae TaxID=2950436 RepID=A0A9J6RLP2_9GAMM|nr:MULTISPECIES: fumarylacetoacetate hydrolase family protein [Dasania]MCR8922811.1 fumarylacetoacetate hydrolase family protein [Dasania sp. GY-MA-18]MCZ0865241.1 fumarylacetoacetate hydrolase family protein [Dasania phycosphaerae]MCZ0868967.1 fumarylacetoacetate hydrolase family protein [Dasania phycosphaerae]